MFTPDQVRMFQEMFANPMFRQGAREFMLHLQREGQQAARKFWQESPYAAMLPDKQQVMERMADFASAMGWVPLAKYEALQQENAALKAENDRLRDTLRELQQSFMAESGAKAQRAWQDVVERQMAMNREATQSFFDALSQFGAPKK